MCKVAVFLADGFEEVEGLTAVDLLRRAGAQVTTYSIMGSKRIAGAHGINLEADEVIENFDGQADLYLLPGGMPGTTNLMNHEGLASLLTAQYEKGGLVSAICAAPSVLANLGFLKDKKATSYPTCLDGYAVAEYLEQPVVVDGNVITSRGVGTAIDFALALIEILFDADKAEQIAQSIIYR